MRLIKPSYNILTNFDLYKNKTKQELIDIAYKEIEIAGRTCYKSEENMTPDSAISFVSRMIKSGHGSMLEHGSVYLKSNNSEGNKAYLLEQRYLVNRYSKVIVNEFKDDLNNRGIPFREFYITTNFRVIVENNWLEDLMYICAPTKYHEKRISVRFICDRGVSHEFVRHRVFSFAQESTRYCNYSKDKFGNELTFILPAWLENIEGDTYTNIYKNSIIHSENAYLDLLKQWDEKIPDGRYKSGYKNNPWTPQQARSVLPNSLKTELIMTGLISDWEHFFTLRCPSSAHPQARELAIPLSEDIKKLLK